MVLAEKAVLEAMTALIAALIQLFLILGKYLADPARKEAKRDTATQKQLQEIAAEVETKDDDRTTRDLRDILG